MASTRLPPDTTLLVTAAGTATGYGVVRTLRDRFGEQLRIVVTDTNPRELVPAAILADGFHQMPGSVESAFTECLLRVLHDEGITLYWPLVDPEILLAAQLAEEGRLPRGTGVMAPTPETARLCLDKLELSRWLGRYGLPTPPTMAYRHARFEDKPVIVKPRSGWGSVGARLVETAGEWTSVAAADGEFVVQEACFAPEITVDVFRSRDGGVVRSVARERVQVKAGVSTRARVYEDSVAESLARRLGEALHVVGAYCFQTMLGAAGEPRITDVNPRPGGGTRLTVATGVDPLSASLLDRLGLDFRVCLPPLSGEHVVVRHWEESVTGSWSSGLAQSQREHGFSAWSPA